MTNRFHLITSLLRAKNNVFCHPFIAHLTHGEYKSSQTDEKLEWITLLQSLTGTIKWKVKHVFTSSAQ